ncbi:adenosylcobalamin-dependent ribonucleoside-diphosphate reductase [Marinoscillum pacificum]|uniref:adenosylcobalamin-dependent ribonucleoside-diphosphate reductase n=1 Tax=Marinoscillum pacificum TaxID=392723 RepID=UPI002156FD49|nr:adenosylcobalamin-dependent ribonucleoside-diphosphate reductase [Marinoscillum pacificum]
MSDLLLENSTYSREDVQEAALMYFGGDELAATTWINKYCMINDENQYAELTPDDMHERMAGEFYRIEKKYQERPVEKEALSDYGQRRKPLKESVIFELFKDFKYLIPQGSVMALLGNPFLTGSLSNCVVIDAPIDSYGGIFYTDQQIAQLCKRRCGVGFDLSTIRPKGLAVHNAAGTSSGIVSFMERFSNTTREVSQNGRRGALMLTIDIAHPDIEDFVTVKQDLSKVTGANISVRVSDEFMKAVHSGEEFQLQWPIKSENPIITKSIDAKELWNTIIASAHNTAEPGIIYWDKQHHYSTSSVYPDFENASTNPCSEIAMQPNDSCRLMALNLFSFINQPFTSEAHFNHELFYEVVYEGQRLMDDLVDLELEHVTAIIEKIANDPEPGHIKHVEADTWNHLYSNGKKGRRTGLGFTALADALAGLGVKFDSDDALDVVKEIMHTKCKAEFDSSVDMAVERGHFEAFDPQIEQTSDFVKFLAEEFPETYERMMTHGRRNISISTVAPTGTVSMLAQTSSGIEPVFMLSYKRRRKATDLSEKEATFIDDSGDRWEEFDVYHKKLEDWKALYPNKAIEESPYAGATAPEIDWQKRIELQALIQKYVTHSISSTINLPADTSVEEVDQIYRQAWQQGLKGITVYRDGSRTGVLISQEETKEDDIIETKAPKRPKELLAKIVRFQNEKENWMAFVGLLNGKPYEIFTGRAEDSFALPAYVKDGWIIRTKDQRTNKTRYDFLFVDSQGYEVLIAGLSRSFDQQLWNYAKLISGILRHGMPLVDVIHLIDNLNFDRNHINTWKNGVNRALKKFVPEGTKSKDHLCPQCGDEEGLIFEEGCLKCKNCGHTACS